MENNQYRKKPVVIEAVQFNGELTSLECMAIPALSRGFGSRTVQIETLEGTMTAQPGDWIIRGVKGELYPCRDDIFRLTYEPVLDAHGEAATIQENLTVLPAAAGTAVQMPAPAGIYEYAVEGDQWSHVANAYSEQQMRDYREAGVEEARREAASAIAGHKQATDEALSIMDSFKNERDALRQELAETKSFLYVRSNSLEMAKVEIAALREQLAQRTTGGNAVAAVKKLPAVVWWNSEDKHPVFNSMNGEDLVLRKDVLALLAAQPVPEAAAQADSVLTATHGPLHLTTSKTRSIVERGYNIVGYVLRRADGEEVCLSAESAVRWLPQSHYARLMHEEGGKLFAAPTAQPTPITGDFGSSDEAHYMVKAAQPTLPDDESPAVRELRNLLADRDVIDNITQKQADACRAALRQPGRPAAD